MTEESCLMCQVKEAKYKCPYCDLARYCSVACFKAHRLECSNARNQSSFLTVDQMNEQTLTQDWAFLSRLQSRVAQAKREREAEPRIGGKRRVPWIKGGRKKKKKQRILGNTT